jgi:uncharacterized protein
VGPAGPGESVLVLRFVLEVTMRIRLVVLLSLMMFVVTGWASAAAVPSLHWQPWSDGAFAQARAEHKFVLLDLEAVWCHWCHVMDDVTYRDPAVVRLLNQRYMLVKVDQDSRPDISNRYQDYGWPATVVFAADGSEIVKRQGYLPPRLMSSMLQAIIDDPSPGPSVEKEAAFRPASGSAISAGLLTRIEELYEKQYDKPIGGWGFVIGIWMKSRSSMRCGRVGEVTWSMRSARPTHCMMRRICWTRCGAGCISTLLGGIGRSRTSRS